MKKIQDFMYEHEEINQKKKRKKSYLGKEQL